MPVTTNTRKLAALLGASGAGIGTDGLLQAAAVDANIATQAELDASLYSDVAVRQDMTTLALRQAIGDNHVAYNLPNSFIDQFQDDSGIGTETNTDRNAGEYITTSLGAETIDGETELLIHSDNASALTTFTDSSSNNHTITRGGSIVHSTAQKKFGATSILFNGTSQYFNTPDHDSLAGSDYTSGNHATTWTMDFWFYPNALDSGSGTSNMFFGASDHVTEQLQVGMNVTSPYNENTIQFSGISAGNIATHGMSTGQWYHVAITCNAGTAYAWINGTRLGSGKTLDRWNTNIRGLEWGREDYSGTNYLDGYLDEIRFSKGVDRTQDSADKMWANSTTSFTPPTTKYGVGDLEAAGTMIGNANVPSSAQTKVSGVMLYKDASGTATIGTDLEIYFTCNGGTNWTEAASYTAVTPVFSTGIKMVKLGETTCTSGSDVRYKAVWANQGAAKETQLHGIGLNY